MAAGAMRSLILMWNIMFIVSLGRNPSVRAIKIPISTISAAPALLPADSPLASPPAALSPSPDITPLFPTTGGPAFSPADSSLPTIPSSPSPPNPDAIGAAPGPFSSLGSLPASSAVRFAPVSTIHLLRSVVPLLLLPGMVALVPDLFLSCLIAKKFSLWIA